MSRPLLRQALAADIPGIQRVRHSVRENRLVSITISDEQVRDAIETTGRGWVVECAGEVVAFAVGNAKNGNIWALFVRPDDERRGYGRLLHDTMVEWLWSQGLERLWLTTEPGTRAQRFYEAAGWQRMGSTDSGELRFEMRNDDRNAHAGPQVGSRVPALTLPSTIGPLELQHFCAGRAVLYVYPATGVPGRDPALDPAPGWDNLPGAAGCTSQCLGFKQVYDRFANQRIRVAGISSQPLAEQRDFVARHAIPFPLLCDDVLALQRAWALPTFLVGGRTFLERLTLYVAANRIERVIYPVVAPAESAERMLELLNEPVA